jgi:hypothetical protein
MKIKWLLRSLALMVSLWPCLALASDLEFSGVHFAFKAAKDVPELGRRNVNVTFYSYVPVGENKNQCSVEVRRWPDDSNVHGRLMVDQAVFRPPIIIAPNQLVKSPSPKYADDAAWVVLAQNFQDKAKFVVLLHRVTAIPEWGLRDIRVQCTMNYTGLFGKSTGEFDDVKSVWIGNLFAMEPELEQQKTEQALKSELPQPGAVQQSEK